VERRVPKRPAGLRSPAREMPGPASSPARITFPARRTHGTCRLLLGASTAMKRHRGFCQKTKRQRQSWGWGKLSAAQEDPCRGRRMLLGSTMATRPREPKAQGAPEGGPDPAPRSLPRQRRRTPARPRTTTAGRKGKIPPGWLRFTRSCAFASRELPRTTAPGDGAALPPSAEPDGVDLAAVRRPRQPPRGNKESTRSHSKPLATQALGQVGQTSSSPPVPLRGQWPEGRGPQPWMTTRTGCSTPDLGANCN